MVWDAPDRVSVGTRTVGSTARAQFRRQWPHECNGSWADRQAFHPSPRCPDLLVPGHVRIHHMLELPRAPDGDRGSVGFLVVDPISALYHRLCVALEHDQRG